MGPGVSTQCCWYCCQQKWGWGPLFPQLPAAWQKKQKSRSKQKWSLKCPQSAGEDFWPGYGCLDKRRVSFFGKAKVSWNRSDQSICFFARKAKFKWDSLSAQFIYLGVALIILISLVSWEKCSWSYPLCQKYNLWNESVKINNTLIWFMQWLLSTLLGQHLSLWSFLSCLVGTLQIIFLGLQLVGAAI